MDLGLIYELQTPRPWHERSEFNTYHEAIEQAVLADRLGFHSVWAVEHHFLVEYSHCPAPEIFLTAVAAKTEQIRVGHGVVLLPTKFNHPARVAERTAAIDIVSNGRLEVGTGRSITEAELGGYDIDPLDSRPMWEEAVRLIPKMWTQEVFEGFEGRYITMPPRPVIPKPIQKPHPPMWMASTQPNSFTVAGEAGIGALCFGFGPMADVAEYIDIYREGIGHCTNPVGSFINNKFSSTGILYCGESDDESLETAGPAAQYFGAQLANLFVPWLGQTVKGYEYYTDEEAIKRMSDSMQNVPDPSVLQRDGYVLMGTPETCLKTLRNYFDMGVDLVLGMCQVGTLPHDKIMKSLERYGKEVLPEVRSWSREHDVTPAPAPTGG